MRLAHLLSIASLLLTLMSLCVPSNATAQGSRADYDRATSYGARTSGLVFRTHVEPHWLDGGQAFWYRVDTAKDAYEFILVDAKAGTRLPAFDHAKLAEALAEASGKDVEANKLPFKEIEFVDPAVLDRIRFRAFGKEYDYDRSANTFVDREKDEAKQENADCDVQDRGDAKRLERPRPSRSLDSADTNICFVNESSGEVILYWLDTSGKRREYGRIASGAKRDQHTFPGHVWIVTDMNERPMAVFEGGTLATTAVVRDNDRLSSVGERRPPRRGSDVSPDGKWRVAFESNNVLLRETDADESYVLTTNGTADNPYEGRVYWSPDSTKFVVMQVEQGEERQIHIVESSPKDQLQPKLHTHTYAKPGDRLDVPRPRLFDAVEKTQVPVCDDLWPNAWSIKDVRWADDSSRFTFLYNERGHQTLRIVEVRACDGVARAIVEEKGETFIDYAYKCYTHYLDETDELIWMSERDGWNHLYLYDAKSGQVKNQITRGEWVVRKVLDVDEENRRVWFQASGLHPDEDPYYIHLCRINFDGSDFTVLTEGDGTHEWDFSPTREYFVDTYSRVDLPPVTTLRNARDGSLVVELEKGDWSALLETGWNPPERFVAKARDGETDIHGIIVRPTNFDPQKKYPVIEKIYAGPHGSFTPKSFSTLRGHYEMAELGFIVVQLDGMGTSNRSKAFHDVCWKNIGDAGFPDRILWMKAAAEDRPWMDISRVGIYGGSAGGQNALRAMLAHGDFYDAAAADCGCHDNRMDKVWWNELWMGWPIGPHYEEQSNVTQAHRLEGKLLLTVGELDTNVDPASTMQVVDALIRADKDFELIVFPGGGHGICERPYGKRRRADFFVRHLLGVEPRWEE